MPGRDRVPPRRVTPADELRHRLYRADVTEDDRRRYRRAQSRRIGLQGRGVVRRLLTALEALRRTARPRRVAAVVLAGGLAAGAAVALLPHRAAPAPTAVRTLAAAPDAGTVALPIDADVRAGFVRALQQGRGAGLAAWFEQHPGTRPPQVTTLSRAATEEHHGTGPQAVRLGPSDLADEGGRVTVMLTLARAADVSWRAVRSPAPGSAAAQSEIAARRTQQLPGLPLSATTAYQGLAPDRLLIRVPAGVAWDAVVVFSD